MRTGVKAWQPVLVSSLETRPARRPNPALPVRPC
jgi:hypothetical protein